MRPYLLLPLLLVISTAFAADEPRPLENLSSAARAALIRRSRVFNVDGAADPILAVKGRDLRLGPPIQGRVFAPGETVECTFVAPKADDELGGSKKFKCRLASGRKVKVKFVDPASDYKVEDSEVWAQVLGSRLAWALGFAAEPVASVRIVCQDCPADPWHAIGEPATRIYDPAMIEGDYAEQKLTLPGEKGGWDWKELARTSPLVGGAKPSERDALKLFAAMISHWDSDAPQQRLYCRDGGVSADGRACATPVLALHDLGQTFNGLGKHTFEVTDWNAHRVFRPGAGCVLRILKQVEGSDFGMPRVSEAGRRLFSRALGALSDAQLADWVRAARLEETYLPERSVLDARIADWRPEAAADWIHAFKAKRLEIQRQRCPR